MSLPTATAAAQTPVDAPAAPFVIHVDAPANSAPQHIPADVDAAPKTLDDDDVGKWEVDICGCCSSPCTAFYAWCLPCFAAGDAFQRIGKSSGAIALAMFVLYVASWALSVLYRTQGREEHYIRDIYYNRYYFEIYEPQIGYLLGALACGFMYVCVVGNVRTTVRNHFRIPGHAMSDFCAAFWCGCCVVAQVNLHAEIATKKLADEQATLPAYTEA